MMQKSRIHEVCIDIFFWDRRLAVERPICLACGVTIDRDPEEMTSVRRNAFEIITEWWICSCGAFAKSHRVRRIDISA